MRRARVPPELTVGPFTGTQAGAAGVSPTALRSTPWRRLLRDVYVHCDVEDSLDLRIAALRLVIPNGLVIRGTTAAWLHGVDVRRQGDLTVHAYVAPGKRPRLRSRPGVDIRETMLGPDDVVDIGGLQVTSPVRTAFDCARTLTLVEGVVVADALAHAEHVTVDALASYAAAHRGLRGVRRVPEILEHIEPLSESPQETRLRLVIVLGGLPRPTAQVNVYDEFGRFIGRLDLAWPELRIGIEYDGALHWEQRRRDDRRRGALADAGWAVRVYGADDVFNRQDYIQVQLANLRRSRRAAA